MVNSLKAETFENENNTPVKATSFSKPLFTQLTQQAAVQHPVTHNNFITLLNQDLQRTLDLKLQLHTFFNILKQQLNISSLEYIHQFEDITLLFGESKHHNCNYEIITEGEPLGKLTFTRQKKFLKNELNTIEHAITALIYPLRNALNYYTALRYAFTDALTGAGNRMSLDNTLRKEIETAKRYRKDLSIAMIDLDKFKTINDNFGHSAGDQVLKDVVSCLSKNIRCTDSIFRYGGEEFVLLLSNTNNEGALIITERLRAMVAGLSCICDTQEIPITVSAGLTTLLPKKDDLDSLLKRSDKALYKAKEMGRNRVININLK